MLQSLRQTKTIVLDLSRRKLVNELLDNIDVMSKKKLLTTEFEPRTGNNDYLFQPAKKKSITVSVNK